MKLVFKIIIFSLSIASAQENSINCSPSEMLIQSHLSCVSCALEKIGRPVPDDNFLGLMGLMARENFEFSDNERSESQKRKNIKNSSKTDLHYRESLKSNPSIIKDHGAGPVEYTLRGEYQKKVIQMLLASGYCGKGKIKSNNSSSNYENFMNRINANTFVVSKDEAKQREVALKELGLNQSTDWESATDVFLMKGDLTSLKFEDQQSFYKQKRPYPTAIGLSSCLTDIKSNYESKYPSSEDAYEACTAIYDGCGIAATPQIDGEGGQIKRKDKNGFTVRVGGDWCAKLYKKPNPKSTSPSEGTSSNPARVK